MKRAAEAGPSTGSKKSRLDPQAATDVFKPDQKKRAADVYRKGTDGTGYIAGKVYERGAPAPEGWQFVLTVELGSRAQVFLSGRCLEHLDELPLVVGAQVRIGTRGLALEALDGPSKPLLLPKRFSWREGLLIHVKNPKTGEEAFVDTWTDDSTAAQLHSPLHADGSDAANKSRILREGGQTPGHTEESTTSSNRISHSPSPSCNTTDPPGRGEAPSLPVVGMAVDEAGPQELAASSGTPPVNEALQAPDSQSDPQNPQSLPSPPPENNHDTVGLRLDKVADIVPHTDLQQPDSAQSADPEPHSVVPDTNIALAEVQNSVVAVTEAEAAPPDVPRDSPPPARRSKKSAGRKERKEGRTSNQRRKAKQREEVEIYVPEAPDAAPQPEAQTVAADPNVPSEEYWEGMGSIPEEILADMEKHQLPAGEGNIPRFEVVPRAGIAAQETPESKPRIEPIPNPKEEEDRQPAAPDPLEYLKMGCVSGFIRYTPLSRIQSATTPHIIGVVDSPRPVTLTRTNEYMLRFTLYDATNYGTSGLSVSLFEKSEKGLPKVDTGDILILREIPIAAFNNTCNAVAASYKGWQWAVFHVKTGMFSTVNAADCARRHFKPEEDEVQFCIRLGDWWRDVSSNAVSFNISATRHARPHKLIGDAAYEEWFDCTVEVVHGFRNENGVYSVFVTDYTRNPNVPPTQGEWCPPRLAPYVLRIEMWDSSSEVGPRMQAGEYYSIRNLRTKISGGGYLEGKMQEGDKIMKLDEDQLENSPRLAELIKRKTDWEAAMNATGGVHEFPHKLMEEAEENCHFKCTVEVVHISPKDDFTYLYVTDYTARTDLVPVAASIAPATLADRVVRVELWDAQVETARSLEPGDYVAIRNLRLRPSGGSVLLSGRLGGDQRLITKLNPLASGNAELRALLDRKEAWTAAQSKTKKEGKRTAKRAARQAAAAAEKQGRNGDDSDSKASPVPHRGKPKSASKRKAFSTLQEVKASAACPAVFRVRARVVDFFPDDLRDCTVLRCTSCDETLPQNRRRCAKCDDAMEDETAVAAFFRLWLRIADGDSGGDGESTTLDVSVADERCTILEGLSPEVVHEDEDAFAMLVARVRPLLGGLLDVRDGEARRRPVTQDEDADPAPMLDLTIGSWLPKGEPDSPETRAYVVLRHALCEDDA